MSILNTVMRKMAYMPFTPAAQQAVDQSGQGMPPQGGMPPMPPDPGMGGAPQPMMDPAMQQGGMPPTDPGMMPPQGGQPPMAPIQIIPGPNGEQVDAETGFIVIDPQQGIEQDPLTGILFNKSLMQFADPNGQPLDPNQAIQIIEQARQGGQGEMPAPGGPAVPPPQGMPMDPAMMQGGQPPMPMPPQQGGPAPMQQMAAEDPNMPMAPQGFQGQTSFDEASGVSVDPQTGMPVDPTTGMLVDVATGSLIDPTTGQAIPPNATAPVTGAAPGGESQIQSLFDAIPGLQELVKSAPRQLETCDKTMTRMMQDINGTRTDLQGLRREIQKTNDNQDSMLARMDNMLAMIEGMIGQQQPAVPLDIQAQPPVQG